jgi:hypothetical protein
MSFWKRVVHRPSGHDGEAKGDLARAVEKLKQMIADPAAKLAPLSGASRKLDPAITGMALGTGDVGLSHGRNVAPPSE